MDTGKDKVKKICEVLKEETLEPARREAEQIIAQAHCDARKIVEKAQREGERIYEEGKKRMQEEENIFRASLNLACKKGLDTLKQEIEHTLFNQALDLFVDKQMKDPQVVARIISAIVKGIEKEGIDVDLQAEISSAVSKQEVNRELTRGIIDCLKSKSVEIGTISGGAQVRLCDKHLTIEMTNEALKTLLANFVREDFRSIIFTSST